MHKYNAHLWENVGTNSVVSTCKKIKNSIIFETQQSGLICHFLCGRRLRIILALKSLKESRNFFLQTFRTCRM